MFRPGLLGLLALTLTTAACGKKGETAAPGEKGMSVEEADRKRAEAQKAAKADTLVSLANQDLAKGRWASARERAKRALESESKNADAYAVLGAANWRAGDYAGSTKAFKEALELDRKNFGAAVGLGRNYQAVGDHKSAIELQDTILAADQNQIDPLLVKLWSYYAQLDAANAVKTLDAVFKLIEPDNPLLPLLQSHAAFMRPLEGKGELAKVEGAKGTSDLQIDPTQGLKHSGATVGGEYTRVLLLELREEARIHKAFADQLKLKEVAKIKTFGSDAETSIVLIPEIKFGDLKITNVPAIVDDLSTFGLGETPGVLLGRQVLSKIGAITFDFPNASLELQSAPPTGAPAGSIASQLLLLDLHLFLVPSVPVTLDGSDAQFYAWLGGSYGTALTVAKKNYLKSGHLPRELDPLDDPNAGLKMIYVDQAKVGDLGVKGVGGLVLANTPPDSGLAQVVELGGFELGGYVNVPLLKSMKVTYALSQGQVFFTPKTPAK
ncbi:tetratricopeptide repeat protein [Nannocystis punicea]|uniref:Tetratricopeptide repeat protein n=1 Tax=Nannocystis punicea TaxID=2995304 RepID=A0ABY7H5R2_9BACT|nr:tetratricopeptide repeat protein [Nannocystis poenicansa]WAS94633.1 tetratricopeptide repeat protein [Nannocystis poenicansa]